MFLAEGVIVENNGIMDDAVDTAAEEENLGLIAVDERCVCMPCYIVWVISLYIYNILCLAIYDMRVFCCLLW